MPDIADANTPPSRPAPHTSRYSYMVLGILLLVYVVNFIDRQIISILAEDIKRDLGLKDSDIGFLYGTAFGVFYALFGIPLGRLADGWSRVRLMAVGLALWSSMTTLSGMARSGLQLTLARFGVGIGEATAGPCAYSLISDYFPKRQRATALAIYSAGLYLGGGLSLFIGGSIVAAWNRHYPGGGPLGLVGWQAAFIAVGLPGLLLALIVSTIKEPIRGAIDGNPTPPSPHPFSDFFQELVAIIPPFTLIGAARRGATALAINLAVASGCALAAWGLISVTKSTAQWTAVALGIYAVFSWASALRHRDPPTFALIWRTPAFLYTAIGYGLLSLMGYGVSAWSAPYAERVLGQDKASIGFILGGGAALAGFLGVIVGGRVADFLRARHAWGRLPVIMFGVVGSMIPIYIAFTTERIALFYGLAWLVQFISSGALGAAAATTQDLVLPRMRGTAAATFFIATTLVGLSLGPYAVGYISQETASLRTGIMAVLGVAPVAIVLLALAWRSVPKAEATINERAAAA